MVHLWLLAVLAQQAEVCRVAHCLVAMVPDIFSLTAAAAAVDISAAAAVMLAAVAADQITQAQVHLV
jgi:hypothetical protein